VISNTRRSSSLNDKVTNGKCNSKKENNILDNNSKMTNIKICHQNCQSLFNKIGILENMSCDLNLDFLCITEHWMDYNEICKYSINELNYVTSYCRTTKAHGGSAIFTRYDVSQIKIMDDINRLSVELDCEIACVEILNLKLVLVSIYRSPNGTVDRFFEIMEKLLSHINRLNKQSVICGDFNINFLGDDKNSVNLVNLFSMYLEVTNA